MTIITFITENIYYLPEQGPPLIMTMLIALPGLKSHYGLGFSLGLYLTQS